MVTKTYFIVFALVFGGLFAATVSISSHAMQDEYYEEEYGDPNQMPEYQDDSQIPEYEQPLEEEGYDQYGDQNPDPEFMEQVEPGEYDQSDDTTILDDSNY